MKRLLKILLGAVLALLLAAAGFALHVQLSGIPHYPTQKVELRVEVTPDRVARGRREVSMLCASCHMDPVTGRLTGRRMEDVPPEFGVAYSKNITQDPRWGIGAWSDGEIAFLLRTGIRRDGQYTPPWMVKLPHMSDDDLADIIAFLRSDDPTVSPAPVEDRESEPTFLTKLLCRTAFKPFPYPAQPIRAPQASDPAAYGRYLVQDALVCYSCHSADFKTVDDYAPERSGGYLGGGNALYTAEGPVLSANITPDRETGIGTWSAEDFRRAMKTGIRPDHTALRYPMQPYPELSDQEVAAIFAYLRTVPPLRNAVKRAAEAEAPSGASRGQQAYYEYGCNACHGDTGVGVYDLRKGPQDFPTDEALVAYIRNPSRFKPGVKMPTWDGVIREEDYGPLVAYVRVLAAAPAAAAP